MELAKWLPVIGHGTLETLYMTLLSTLMAYIIGIEHKIERSAQPRPPDLPIRRKVQGGGILHGAHEGNHKKR